MKQSQPKAKQHYIWHQKRNALEHRANKGYFQHFIKLVIGFIRFRKIRRKTHTDFLLRVFSICPIEQIKRLLHKNKQFAEIYV